MLSPALPGHVVVDRSQMLVFKDVRLNLKKRLRAQRVHFLQRLFPFQNIAARNAHVSIVIWDCGMPSIFYHMNGIEICFRISIPRSNVLAVSVRIKAFSKNQGLSQSYQKCTAAHHNHKHSANCTVHSATVQIAQQTVHNAQCALVQCQSEQ